MHEAGLSWEGAGRALELEPATQYERAVLANCVAAWRGPWPEGAAPRDERLEGLLEPLRQALHGAGHVASEGRGLMSSWRHQLDVEATALAGVAFEAAGDADAVRRTVEALARFKGADGRWPGTQATAKAVRALTRLVPHEAPGTVVAELDAGRGGPLRSFLAEGHDRPLRLERTLSEVEGGERVAASLRIEAEAERVGYGLSLRYRVARPRGAPEAPYALATKAPAQVAQGDPFDLRFTLKRRAPPPEGQVVAVVPLPGGCRLDPARAGRSGEVVRDANRVRVRDGVLEVYWEDAPPPGRYRVALVADAVGTYASAPAAVYPYYTSGRRAYAPGLGLKVLPGVDAAAAAKSQGRDGVLGR